MRSLGASALKRVPAMRRAFLTIVGLGLLALGAWTIYHPAGIIVAGLGVLVFEGLQDGGEQ